MVIEILTKHINFITFFINLHFWLYVPKKNVGISVFFIKILPFVLPKMAFN
jgi:hypothetical protein